MPAEPAAVRRSSAGWKVALRLGLSALFLVILFTRVPDLHGLHLPDTHPLETTLLLGVAIVAACVGIILSAWRWQQVLRLFDAHVPLPTLTRHYFAGQFVSNVMPSTVGGDVVRVARCAKNVDSTSVAFGSVVLERLSGMIALPLLVIVGFALEALVAPHRARLARAVHRRRDVRRAGADRHRGRPPGSRGPLREQ